MENTANVQSKILHILKLRITLQKSNCVAYSIVDLVDLAANIKNIERKKQIIAICLASFYKKLMQNKKY